MGNLAKGRSLNEFRPLNDAEAKILAAVATGNEAIIGETRPEAKDASNKVRAEFLRFLALGGDDSAPVHERGLRVQGVRITGLLDLSRAEIAGSLVLALCQFAETPELLDAQIRGFFSLAGSHVPGMKADRLHCRSSVFLRAGFISKGEIRLLGANIGGDLQCNGGNFANPGKQALIADGIEVGGTVFMSEGFTAKGAVRLRGATIGGNLECGGGAFENPGRDALTADRMKVGGNVVMCESFTAKGEVRLLGADIGGDLVCRGGSFGSGKSPAINCEGMAVSGTFFFDNVNIGSGMVVNLTAAHVGRLVDDLASWPQNTVLDGFVYESLAGNAPTNAKARLAWLDKQSPEHSGKAKNPREFRPQPWLQLHKALREQGHLEDARQVAVAFENRKRECRVIGEISDPATAEDITTALAQWFGSRVARGFHRLYGLLIGYGYRPLRLLGIVALVWIFCTGLFYVGANNRVFGPTDPKLSENPAYDSCNPEKNPAANWTRCKTLPRAYPAFFPPLYALDVLLPIAKLGQQDHWVPLDPRGAQGRVFWLIWATQFAVWFEIGFGWIAGLLLVATVTGLAKRHED